METRTDPTSPDDEALAGRPPDRLSVDPASPFYRAAVLERGIGIRFNGAERTTVEEYCVSEGWVRVAAGKARDRRGRPILLKLKGEVVAYFQDIAEATASSRPPSREAD